MRKNRYRRGQGGGHSIKKRTVEKGEDRGGREGVPTVQERKKRRRKT